MLPVRLYKLAIASSLICIPVTSQLETTTISTADKANATELSIDVFNSTVSTDHISNITVPTDDMSDIILSTDHMSNITLLTDDLNTTLLTYDQSNMTILTDGMSENATVPEETEYQTTSDGSVVSQSSATKADHSVDCTKFTTPSTVKPVVQLKAEPLCTESGSILDQLTRFIGYQFPKHECGNPNSTTKYTEMLYCSMLNTHTMCLQPVDDELKHTNMEMVPTILTVRKIIERLCYVDHVIAKDCLFKRLKYVTRCVKTEVDSILSFQNKEWTYGAIDQCRHLEVKILCMWEYLQPCNEVTAWSMASLIFQHFRSETCTLSGVQTTLPIKWFLFVAVLVTQVLLFIELT